MDSFLPLFSLLLLLPFNKLIFHPFSPVIPIPSYPISIQMGSGSSSSSSSSNWEKWDNEFFGDERRRDLVYGFVTEDATGKDGSFFALSTLSYGTLFIYYIVWLVVYTVVACTCGACSRFWFRCCCRCCIRTPVVKQPDDMFQNPLEQFENEMEEEEEAENSAQTPPPPSVKKRRRTERKGKKQKKGAPTERITIKSRSF